MILMFFLFLLLWFRGDEKFGVEVRRSSWIFFLIIFNRYLLVVYYV